MIETAASIALLDGGVKTTPRSRTGSPTRQNSGESGAWVSPSVRVTGDGDSGWPQRCLREGVHTDQLVGSSDDGAQNPVLDKPRPGRPSDRTNYYQ